MKQFSGLLTLFAFALGTAAAYFDVPLTGPIAQFISESFIRFLKLLSLPLIFLSISSTILNIESLDSVKRLFRKVLTFTLLTTFIAATVGLALFILIDPAKAPLAEAGTLASGTIPSGSPFSYLLTIIPDNIVDPFLHNNVLAVILIAVTLSLAVQKTAKKGCQTIAAVFKELFNALLNVTSYVIKLLPLAIFGFAYQFTESVKTSGDDLRSLLLYGICVVAANLIQGVIVLPLILKSRGIAPFPLFRNMLPALSTAFFTKSSGASLPMALECAKKAKISDRTASFSFPLCSVINMNGCAAFIIITTLFVMVRSGVILSIGDMIPWIFLASLAAIGNAGVPMGCFFLTSAFLVGMDIPLGVMGLILPLYSLFDMVETALNVWSDSCVTAIADKEVKEAPIANTLA